MALPTNNFMGRLGDKNVNIYDIISKLNYRIPTTKERIEYIDKLVNDNDFFQIYNDQYYKVNINSGDCLSKDINVFNFLDAMADYILFAPDKKELDNNREDENKNKVKPNKTIREYHKDARKNKKLVSLDALIDLYMVEGYYDDIDIATEKAIEFQDEIYAMNEIIRDDGRERIIEDGMNNDFVRFSQLQQYKVVNTELQKMKKIKSVNKKKLNIWISENYKDMIMYKRSLEGTFSGKQAIHMFQPTVTIENADYSDEEFVSKYLQYVYDDRFGINTDIGVILIDIRDLIKESDLTENEHMLLHLYSKRGMIQKDVGDMLGLSQKRINTMIETIAHKITVTHHKKYIDNYFLNVKKGKYKKCSKCGDVKLTYSFDKHPQTKDGLYPSCKECRKIKQF